MAKQQKAKKNHGDRNADRSNGKAEKQNPGKTRTRPGLDPLTLVLFGKGMYTAKRGWQSAKDVEKKK